MVGNAFRRLGKSFFKIVGRSESGPVSDIRKRAEPYHGWVNKAAALAVSQLSLSSEKAELLALTFHAPFYRRFVPDQPADAETLWRHYLREGVHRNVPPGPFFDPAWCAKEMGLVAEEGGEEVPPAIMLRWLDEAVERVVIPTPLFDARHYLAKYRDIRNAGINPFYHFLKFGENERRQPRRMPDDGPLARILRERGTLSPTPLRDLLSRFPTRRLKEALDPETWKRAQRYFMPAFYRLQHEGLLDGLGDEELFLHFHAAGLDKGLRPTLLFLESWYRQVLELEIQRHERDRALHGMTAETAAPLPIEPHVDAWCHWLVEGAPRRIVPTPLFDAAHYLGQHKDLKSWRRWIFDHFVLHGCREKMREPSPFFSNRHYVQLHAPLKHEIIYIDCLLRGVENIRSLHPRLAKDPEILLAGEKSAEKDQSITFLERIFLRLQTRRTFLERPVVREMVQKAREIEPLVVKPDGGRKITWLPRIHDRAGLLKEGRRMRERIGGRRVDTLVLLPHVRQLSGASKIGVFMADAIRNAYPDQRLLLVLTDVHEPELPSWMPEGMEILHFAKYVPQGSLIPESRLALLLDIVSGTRARRVINVNSRLAWDMYLAYGQQMKHFTHLYSYLFCWDKDRNGNRVGYPVRELALCFNDLTGVFCDTRWLREEIIDRFMLPHSWQQRLHTLYTPAEKPVGDFSAQLRRPRPKTGRPYLALWAGRLDRQKRPDIVMQIARQLPEVEIVMYGHEVLGGGGIDPKRTPDNVIIRPPVGSFAEMQPDAFDFYLYTSEWDGLPNVLITAGINAFPTVSAIVGGIGELITEKTGWPVTDPLNPEAYVTRIREMLAAPEEAERRARALREHTRNLCNEAAFARDIMKALEREGRLDAVGGRPLQACSA